MRKNYLISLFNILNIKESRKNLKENLALIFSSSIIMILTSYFSMGESYTRNPMFYVILPITIMVLLFIISAISGFMIQYSWLRAKVGFSYAFKFASFTFLTLSLSQVMGSLYQHFFDIPENTKIKISLIFFVILSLIQSYIVSFYTVKREYDIEKDKKYDFENDDFSEDSLDNKPHLYKKSDNNSDVYKGEFEDINFKFYHKRNISLIGNMFRVFIVLIFAVYMIVGTQTYIS